MALADAYADVSEYKDRVGKITGDADEEVLGQLAAASRFIDRECGRGETGFGLDGAVAIRLFEGNGLTRLYVDDIATLTGLIVKADLDTDFDFDEASEVLTINVDFWAGPANAALRPEPAPYTYLDIVPMNARLQVWPEYPRSVQVTAIFGWPSVPGAIKEATIDLVRKMRDIQRAGASEALQNIDMAMQMAGRQSFIFQDMRRQYRRGVPFA